MFAVMDRMVMAVLPWWWLRRTEVSSSFCGTLLISAGLHARLDPVIGKLVPETKN